MSVANGPCALLLGVVLATTPAGADSLVQADPPAAPPGAKATPPASPASLPGLPGDYAWYPVAGTLATDALAAHDWVSSVTVRPPAGLDGLGFPGIAGDATLASPPLQRRWESMIAWRDGGDGPSGGSAGDEPSEPASLPIAAVRCMGLSPQAVARRADRYEALIGELAASHGVDVDLVKAVVTEESCFDPMARSTVGALGLMQLMPETATWLRVVDPDDPAQNLGGGIGYLASLLSEFSGIELSLAAYNAGPGTVRRHGEIPPWTETRAYVERVMSNFRRYAAATRLALERLEGDVAPMSGEP